MLGTLEVFRGRFASATAIFTQLLFNAQANADVHMEAEALIWQGLILLLSEGDSEVAATKVDCARALTSPSMNGVTGWAPVIYGALLDFFGSQSHPAAAIEIMETVAVDSTVLATLTDASTCWSDAMVHFHLAVLLLRGAISCASTPQLVASIKQQGLLLITAATRVIEAFSTWATTRFTVAVPIAQLLQAHAVWVALEMQATQDTSDREPRRRSIARLLVAIAALTAFKMDYFVATGHFWLSQHLATCEDLHGTTPTGCLAGMVADVVPLTDARDIRHHEHLARTLLTQAGIGYAQHPLFKELPLTPAPLVSAVCWSSPESGRPPVASGELPHIPQA